MNSGQSRGSLQISIAVLFVDCSSSPHSLSPFFTPSPFLLIYLMNLHFTSFHGQGGNVSSTSLVLSDCIFVLLDVFFPLL